MSTRLDGHGPHPDDSRTAAAFADSWNHLPPGSVYTRAQFEEWMRPLTEHDVRGKRVLELGCGNGSLMVHLVAWAPQSLEGVDLGDAVIAARRNLAAVPQARVQQADLVEFRSERRDVVYCIGVLHHLKRPRAGFEAVLANTVPGGRFHCWVYAREGTLVVRWFVEPLRRVCCRFPWWFSKYLVATPLVAPYFVYARLLHRLRRVAWLEALPLFAYSLWIAPREFAFFRHVAFDQLVTPQTCYLDRATIAAWLEDERIEPESRYLIFRNGNSWKFGGRLRPAGRDRE